MTLVVMPTHKLKSRLLELRFAVEPSTLRQSSISRYRHNCYDCEKLMSSCVRAFDFDLPARQSIQFGWFQRRGLVTQRRRFCRKQRQIAPKQHRASLGQTAPPAFANAKGSRPRALQIAFGMSPFHVIRQLARTRIELNSSVSALAWVFLTTIDK